MCLFKHNLSWSVTIKSCWNQEPLNHTTPPTHWPSLWIQKVYISDGLKKLNWVQRVWRQKDGKSLKHILAFLPPHSHLSFFPSLILWCSLSTSSSFSSNIPKPMSSTVPTCNSTKQSSTRSHTLSPHSLTLCVYFTLILSLTIGKQPEYSSVHDKFTKQELWCRSGATEKVLFAVFQWKEFALFKALGRETALRLRKTEMFAFTLCKIIIIKNTTKVHGVQNTFQ